MAIQSLKQDYQLLDWMTNMNKCLGDFLDYIMQRYNIDPEYPNGIYGTITNKTLIRQYIALTENNLNPVSNGKRFHRHTYGFTLIVIPPDYYSLSYTPMYNSSYLYESNNELNTVLSKIINR